MRIVTASATALILALSAGSTLAEVTQDCILEGTVKNAKNAEEQKKVYVAFHSARDPENQQTCNMKRRKKLHFKAPSESEIGTAPVGSKVRYRYREHDHEQGEMELISVSS